MLNSCKGTDLSTLDALDAAIEDHQFYISQKENYINELNNRLENANSTSDKYKLCNEIYQNYQYFSLDSAFIYVHKAENLAHELNDDRLMLDSRMNYAFLFNFSGMSVEASDILNSIDISDLDHDLKRNYYYLGFNIYNSLSQYSIDKKFKDKYTELKKTFRDSAILLSQNDVVLKAEKMMDNCEYDEAIQTISQNLLDGVTTNEAGLKYYILSKIYKEKGEKNEQIKYLAMASVASLKNGIRQYVALNELAEIMHDLGDLNHAYTYIHVSLNDAKECNSQIRLYEISNIMSIIDSSVIIQKQKNRNFLIAILIGIATFIIILAYFIIKLKSKNKILKETQASLKMTNSQLQELNSKLAESNDRLESVNNLYMEKNRSYESLNASLTESNRIKAEYINRFMHLCVDYRNKMENYRNHLLKVASKRNFDLLYDAIHSSRYIEKEINEFYSNFDKAFLNIYPDYLDRFNALLRPECKIVLKNNDQLNTELRIFALIKLGISDREEIQEFLRCSSSTVYNYRTNMKNKAIKRDTFEEDVAAID